MSTATSKTADRVVGEQPGRAVRALAGMSSAAVALALGHLASVPAQTTTSPAILVGSQLVDAAPTSAKEVVVRLLGTADKPVLIVAVVLVTVLLGALLGMVAWARPGIAGAGIVAIGLVGAVIALVRPGMGVLAAMPSLAAIVGGLITLRLLVRRGGSRPADDGGAGGRGPSRRVLLGAAVSAVVVAASAGGGAVLNQVARAGDLSRRMFNLPRPVSPAPALPEGVQVPGNTPFRTSIDDFYRIDIALVTPRYPAEGWTLTVDGAVDQPLTLSYADLLELPMIERDITLTCVSNEVGGPYVGTARWLGVSFAEILDRVGVQSGVDQLLSHSLDGGYTASTPIEALTDGRDAMIAIAMNGEVLPDKNGFPARMVVPGLFGYVSATKWLSRLEFTSYAAKTAYWTDRGWSVDGPILTQARIDVPDSLGTLAVDKPVLAGVAWAQHRGVEKVEIRIDEGEWQTTKLAADGGIDLWRQWTHVVDAAPGRHSAEVRATDRTGHTQPGERREVFPAGATGWHRIQFTLE